MLCKLDENLPVEAADLLKTGGHECHTVFDEQLGGADDTSLYERCRREERVLLTLDLDFADIRTYPPAESAGIVVLRPEEPDRDRVLQLVRQILPAMAARIGHAIALDRRGKPDTNSAVGGGDPLAQLPLPLERHPHRLGIRLLVALPDRVVIVPRAEGALVFPARALEHRAVGVEGRGE